MSDSPISPKIEFVNNKRYLIFLIVTLVGFTAIYQVRPFVNDLQFLWISIPTYSILPGFLTIYSAILAKKLFKQKDYQAKAFLFFALGSLSWLIAEQIWLMYDQVWTGEPFPSEADIFYILSYPLFTLFLFLSINPILKSISRKAWMFAIGLSSALLFPSITFAYDDLQGEPSLAIIIGVLYPILASIKLVPAIVGILYLTRQGANFSWMLVLFGLIVYSVADTFFLFSEIEGTYFDGHPVDLVYVYAFILLIFSLFVRLKFAELSSSKNKAMFFSETIQFETITKLGIPLTLAIFSLIIFIIFTQNTFGQSDSETTNGVIGIEIAGILAVFIIIVIILNRNISKLVQLRTDELIRQNENLEEIVQEKTQEVRKSERLSAIGELSGRLAHDLRNPLSVIKMSLDLIEQNSSDKKISDPDVNKRIHMIQQNVDRIAHQVNDVLDFVRNSPLKLTQISIKELVENSSKKVKFPENVKIQISGNDKKIYCDPIKIDAVFVNLLLNSIQELSNGGSIEVKIQSKENFVIIDFVDSGKGIPDEYIQKIFEPLYTTKQKGTGLGLSSCKNIAEQHLGAISITNNPTTFSVSIPANLDKIIGKNPS